MTKLIILLIVFLQLARAERCNATQANYLSPHSLGKQDEMFDALAILSKQVRPAITTYQYGNANYTLYNITVKTNYIDGKQTAEIISGDEIRISGGKIEFLVNFNFSISRIGQENKGWAYGNNKMLCSFCDVGPSQLHQRNRS